MFGSFDFSYAKPLQNNKLERKLSAYIEIEPYIGHHCLTQRVRNYMRGVKWAEKLYVSHHLFETPYHKYPQAQTLTTFSIVGCLVCLKVQYEEGRMIFG